MVVRTCRRVRRARASQPCWQGMRIRRSVCAANRSAARPARVVGLDRPAVISIKRLGIRHDFEPEAAQLVSKRSRHTGDDGFAASRHSGPEVIEAIVSAARANGTAEQSEDIFDVVDGIDPGRYANLATFASLGQRVADAATRAYRQSGNRRCPDLCSVTYTGAGSSRIRAVRCRNRCYDAGDAK